MKRGNESRNAAASGTVEDRRWRIAGAGLLAAICVATLFAGQLTDAADGKKKKKKYNLVGKWQGTTDHGGTVSFTLTRDGKIVGFTLTNVELDCTIAFVDEQGSGWTRSKKTATITHGPMPMTGKSRKWPQGKKFEFHDPPVPRDSAGEGGDYTGELGGLLGGPTHDQILPGKKSLVGEVSYLITNGPTPGDPTDWAPGTEACDTGGPTGQSLLDWWAKKPGAPGKPVPDRVR